jgi:hypothetical protein
MKKENPKHVAIDEVRKIKAHIADLHEALTIFSEKELGSIARDCAKHTKKLSAAVKTALASLGKVKTK